VDIEEESCFQRALIEFFLHCIALDWIDFIIIGITFRSDCCGLTKTNVQ
jgi:hypothetical protein